MNGKLYIVDLDVGMPDSCVLGGLKTHFRAQGGLRCATLLSKCLLRTKRESLIRNSRDNFTQGRFVRKAWHGDELLERGSAHLVIWAEDKAGLVGLVQTIDDLHEP